jgi:hypothetical protein
MPTYNGSPFLIVTALTPGEIGYSWGGFNDDIAPTRMLVSNVALTSNVATLTVQIVEGNVPAIGSLISVQGTASTSGLFNVTNVALASVTIVAATGAGTVTLPLTHANVASVANTGQAIVKVPYTFDTLPGTAAGGKQFAIPHYFRPGFRQLSWFTAFTGAPSTVAAALQVADEDVEASYTTIDTSTVATGETREIGKVPINGIAANFVRIQMASTGGTSPTVRAGIVLS